MGEENRRGDVVEGALRVVGRGAAVGERRRVDGPQVDAGPLGQEPLGIPVAGIGVVKKVLERNLLGEVAEAERVARRHERRQLLDGLVEAALGAERRREHEAGVALRLFVAAALPDGDRLAEGLLGLDVVALLQMERPEGVVYGAEQQQRLTVVGCPSAQMAARV